MRKRYFLSSLTVAAVLAATVIASANLLAASGNPQAPTAAAQKLLTIAEVEGIAGVKGVKLIPKDISKGAGGDLNFANADGSMLLMVITQPASTYKDWKAQSVLVKGPVSGVGDEAFSGPAGAMQYVIYFRKGDHAASISSFFNNTTMKPLLSQDQLKAAAKIVAGRL